MRRTLIQASLFPFLWAASQPANAARPLALALTSSVVTASQDGAAVQIKGEGVSQQLLKKGSQQWVVFSTAKGGEIEMLLPGAGVLSLTIHAIFPGGKKPKKPSVTITVDEGKTKTVKLQTRQLTGGQLTDASKSKVAKPTTFNKKLTTSVPHLVRVAARAPIAVRVSFLPSGQKQLAQVTFDSDAGAIAAPVANPLAGALGLSFDSANTPTPPSPTQPAPPPRAPETPAAAPATPEVQAEILAQSAPSEAPAPKVFPSTTLVSKLTGERINLARVPELESYTVSVFGPGILTVRMYPLLVSTGIPMAEGPAYSFVILEDDAILQTIDGRHGLSQSWSAEADATLRVADPHEYRLQVGAKSAHVAFQISGAPNGMLIRHEFQQEEASLSAISLGIDGSGLDGGVTTPTTVMEVDVVTRPDTTLADMLGASCAAGVGFQSFAATPGASAALGLRFPLPFLSRRHAVGALQTGGIWQVIAVRVADPDGGVVPAKTSILTVPIVAQVTGRLPIGDSFAFAGTLGGGVLYVLTTREAQSSKRSKAAWLPAAKGSLAGETDFGLGWIGAEAAYLWSKPTAFEGTIRNLAPGGLSVGLYYRVGI